MKLLILNLLLISSAFVSSFHNSLAADTIKPNQTLLDNGQTLVSTGEEFELGFFSPLNSNNRYVGIWYKNVSQRTVVWVANRDNPLSDSAGVLTITPTGNILISSTNQSDITLWSSNSSANDPILQLLNTGNLVIKEGRNLNGNGNYKWQSFDHPGDTLIAGMKMGWNLKTGQNWYLTTWKTPQDPSTGNYRCYIDTRGLPQLVLFKGSEMVFRSGPWDGARFGGNPALKESTIFKPIFIVNKTHVYYTSENDVHSSISRFWVSPSGSLEQQRWSEKRGEWLTLFTPQKDECDKFSRCGPYGVCDINRYPVCVCPSGFVPKAPQDWFRADNSGGCVLKTKSICGVNERFKKFSGMKTPYSRDVLVKKTLVRREECEAECLRNCSCVAYAMNTLSGCILWFGDLLDIRVHTVYGQNFYIRMAASELESDNEGIRTAIMISAAVVLAGFLLLVSVSGYTIWMRIYNSDKSKADERLNNRDEVECPKLMEEDIELPSFSLAIISTATDNFSTTNILGEGGFGTVYKGVLPSGQEIAVKRLSKDSGQGLKEFKNEVILITKLQHRNLVRLFGCCIHKEDRMLIYEYMRNKSLDLYIFDQTRGTALDWHRRFDIIVGIARGLLYLHRDSRLRIIHRDLKASNILLDSEMNPKISDFGLARIFGGEQTEVNTKRVMGTYGYMSPEYAIDGKFSVKSDVFSFGVMVLEIASGKKNRGFCHPDHHLNLLGHAWKLWNEGRAMEMMDSLMESRVVPETQGLRCIQVGLLCVQKRPEDRPLMSSVLLMLDTENPPLPQPKQPGFYAERILTESNSASTGSSTYTSNEVTVTMLHGR